MDNYVNGSDLLVTIGEGAIGHCTTHTTTFSTETKDMAFKPLASEAKSTASLFKSKRVTGLTVQVKAEGLHVYSETESGLKAILAKWKAGSSVGVKLFDRGNDESPYCSGNFVISSLENTAAAGEDATYSVTFDNDGAVTVDETKLDAATA